MGRSLDKDIPMVGPQAAERNEKGQPAERVSDLGFHYIRFFPWTLPFYLAGRAGVFCNKNTGIVAALKHHHHPLKYLANSYFGQGGGEACLSASG